MITSYCPSIQKVFTSTQQNNTFFVAVSKPFANIKVQTALCERDKYWTIINSITYKLYCTALCRISTSQQLQIKGDLIFYSVDFSIQHELTYWHLSCFHPWLCCYFKWSLVSHSSWSPGQWRVYFLVTGILNFLQSSLAFPTSINLSASVTTSPFIFSFWPNGELKSDMIFLPASISLQLLAFYFP